MNKLLLIALLAVILFVGFYFFRTKSTSVPIQVTPTPTLVVKEEAAKDQIIKALSQKNNWDVSRVELNISKIEGDFAKGDAAFKDEMGGGLWFAAKVNGAWKIVYDGNGIITCDMLTNYQDFPKDLIPNCYDLQTDKLLTR
jgi:hypothetical protein